MYVITLVIIYLMARSEHVNDWMKVQITDLNLSPSFSSLLVQFELE